MKELNVYVISSVDGIGKRIGRFKGFSEDADGDLIIEADIDALSCTGNLKNNSQYKELLEGCDFSTKFNTYVIAFCPDTDSWFVTNHRFFYYEYDKEFATEEEGIEFFKNNSEIFYNEEIKMKVYRPSIRKKGVWLENIKCLVEKA